MRGRERSGGRAQTGGIRGGAARGGEMQVMWEAEEEAEYGLKWSLRRDELRRAGERARKVALRAKENEGGG